MNQEIKDTITSAFLMKNIQGKNTAAEDEFFRDNHELM